jgi:hypothetical protein
MRQQMAHLTLDIVGSTLLGMDLRQDADDVRPRWNRRSRWSARTVSGTTVTPQYRVTMRPCPDLSMQVTAR